MKHVKDLSVKVRRCDPMKARYVYKIVFEERGGYSFDLFFSGFPSKDQLIEAVRYSISEIGLSKEVGLHFLGMLDKTSISHPSAFGDGTVAHVGTSTIWVEEVLFFELEK